MLSMSLDWASLHAYACTKSGWQSACCDVTESTEAWSKCQWTDDCFDDDTCPTGYSSLVAKSRNGWGGHRTCKSGKYNYCCTETPKSFKNCEWVGNADSAFDDKQLCTDSCPSGSTRIAEQSLTALFGPKVPANAKDCVYGNEAYCCSGDKESDKDERGTIQYRDDSAKQFDHLLQKFLADPVCPAEWASQYSPSNEIFTRDLLRGRATDQGPVLDALVPIMTNWLTSETRRRDMEEIYQMRIQQFGFGDSAANVSTYTDLLYQGDWSGRPVYTPTYVISEALCNLAASRAGMANLSAATRSLCVIPSDTSSASSKRHLLEPRRLNDIILNDRTGDDNLPSVAAALRGVRSGELSLHYLRWIRPTDPADVILEAAFWIGPRPGVRPDQSVRDNYSDRTHTVRHDRWIVFHFHIRLDNFTFRRRQEAWYPGVVAFNVYHSQATTNTNGGDPRVQYQYSVTVAGPNDSGALNNRNNGMRDYNDRSSALNCRTMAAARWYMGYDYVANGEIDSITSTSNQENQYAVLVNNIGLWFHERDTFSVDNLARLWPELRNRHFPTPDRFNARNFLRPDPRAFADNWLPDPNERPQNVNNADS
ncbi:hypothetical protein LZL87_008846 [Fusarium oxysporum]|nr:hypothetical protein LZL87_008846 [Fusarium oxysporum]